MYGLTVPNARSGVRTRAAAMILLAAAALVAAACTSSGEQLQTQDRPQSQTTEDGRSSGSLEEDPAASASGTDEDGGETNPDSDQAPSRSTDQDPSGNPDGSGGDPDDGSQDPGGDSGSDPAESDSGGEDPPDSEALAPEPELRPDGLELVFADGSLGPAALGSTIEEMRAALGPAYEITPEENIRVDFPSGYSVSRDDEVLFWAIEEDGLISVIMSSHRRVGLDSGLHPGMALADAIALHGEPSLTIGPEIREFASFEDGTGGGSLSILVAIGQFGGPVGMYETLEIGSEASGYELEEANIKELWFWNR